MKSLHNRVNIVPVIAKADTLTRKEISRLKKRILDEIAKHNIKIYQLPDVEEALANVNRRKFLKEHFECMLNAFKLEDRGKYFYNPVNTKMVCIFQFLLVT